jgi:hypothetical protein
LQLCQCCACRNFLKFETLDALNETDASEPAVDEQVLKDGVFLCQQCLELLKFRFDKSAGLYFPSYRSLGVLIGFTAISENQKLHESTCTKTQDFSVKYG